MSKHSSHGSIYELTGLPRWKDPPEQSKVDAYELALAALEGEIRKLRDEKEEMRKRAFLAEREVRSWREYRRSLYFRPPVFSFMGFHMESADIDG